VVAKLDGARIEVKQAHELGRSHRVDHRLFSAAAPGYASAVALLATPDLRMPLPLPRSPRVAAPLAVAATLAAVACGDPFRVEAQSDTIERDVTFVALNGTSPALPAAVLLAPEPIAVRPGPDFVFDLAFDITPAGVAQLLPLDIVGQPGVTGGRTVGIQKLTGQSYESVLRAPAGGYTVRQAVPIAVGDVGVVQALAHPSCLGSFVGTTVFAKFRVDAIDVASRSVRLRILADPNCGFRGLETGRPSR
jgi:hypothetical protein